MFIESINPSTGDLIQRYDEMTVEQVNQIIENTHREFLDWRHTTFADRAARMKKAAEILRSNSSDRKSVV